MAAVPSATDQSEVIRRWIGAYNERDEAGEAAARAEDYVAYPPDAPLTLRDAEWRAFIAQFVDAMPDLRIEIEEVIAEGDFVAARNTFSGTFTGSFQGIPGDGRRITFAGLEFNRLEDGKVVEHWFQLDQPALFKQLGLVVVPGPRLLARIALDRVKRVTGRGA